MTAAELIAELQAASPSADTGLRERVRSIAAATPPARPSPSAWFRRITSRRVVLVALPAAAVVLLAVAGAGGLLRPGAPVQPVQRESVAADAAAGQTFKASAPPAASTAPLPGPTAGRAQRTSAQLLLSVEDTDALSEATQQALRITRDLGGHLVSASYATSDTGTSTLVLKVPSEHAQDAITRLAGLGTIVSQQVQIDDLQEQVDALSARETALRGQIARLSARIASPSTDATTKATLQARRAAAQAELARIRASRAQVDAEAREATIQLTLQTDASAAVPVPASRWHRGIDRAGEILAVEAEVLLALLVVLVPAGLVVLAGALVRRAVRRRRDDELLAAP
jgi:cell division protein FtsB